MTVTAVAFDFGGVLTVPPFAGLEAYGDELGLPAGTLSDWFTGDAMAELEIGAVTSREFFKRVCIECESQHGVRVDIHALATAAALSEELDPEMLALVEELHASLATALLTNNVATATWRETFPVHLFDVVIDSSEVGLRKPSPAVYRVLLDRLGCEADEVVFFDDFERNVTGARAVGMHAYRFTGIDGCRQALNELGVLEAVAR
jgi:epoxide hydrolase-like predicted phosphatase